MRLFILENCLREYLGHFLNCTLGIAREARSRGSEVIVHANRAASPAVLSEIGASATFTETSWCGEGAADAVAAMHVHGSVYAKDCEALEPFRAGDVVLVPTALEAQVYGLTKYLAQLPASARPRVAFNFHWHNLSGNPTRADAYAEAFSRAAETIGADRMLISAVTDRIRMRLQSVAGDLEVHRFPLPQDYAGLTAGPPASSPAGPIHVSVLGRSLKRKGTPRLLPVVHRVLQARPDIRFFIQATWKAPLLLLLLIAPRVRLKFGGLSPDVYRRTMRNTDIVLTPYNEAAYRGRASGVFADGAATGCVAVVPANTWMARHIEAGHAAGVICDPGSPDDISRAVLDAASHVGELSKKARQSARYWHEKESAGAFVERLFEHFEPGTARGATGLRSTFVR